LVQKKGGHTFGKSNKKENKRANGSGVGSSVAEKVDVIINAVSDGVAVISGNGIINSFNPAASKMTGWAINDVVNLDFRSVFILFDISEHPVPDNQNPIVSTMFSARQTRQGDIFLQTASKKYIRVAVEVIPIGEPAKQEKTGSLMQKLQKPIGEGSNSGPGLPSGNNVIVVFRDVTAEKHEGHKQSDFISTASHEMRTPIAIIEGYLGMLLNPTIATIDSRAQVYAQKAHSAAQHLGNLFRDLLDVTKLDDDRLRNNPILVDAGAAARQAVDQMQNEAKKKGIELKYESVGEIQPLYIIYVDIDQLQEVLYNIIDNAIKYTKQGSVKVSAVDNQGKVRISVADTGIGIPAEDVPHLFQKFYRVDNSDTREIGGSGLGLYLIKQLTEKLGGQIGVESDYGHGSTFWIEFDILSRDQAIVKAREIKARQGAQPLREKS
jgi:signal transduction histidine kinase